MKLLGEVLSSATQFLKDRGDPRARYHAEQLMSYVLKLPRVDLYLQFDRPMQEDELNCYRALFKRKAQAEPLEYVIGEVSFYHCTLDLTPDVLIPRQETEILLDHICNELKGQDVSGMQVWDVCTGSGCLGIGLKKAYPQLEVALSDLSAAALEVAQRNCKRNEVVAEVLQGDLLTPFKGRRADIVVCNPPYVSESEFHALDRSVREFEPKMALVGGASGLLYYERLAVELPLFLKAGAKVYFEIGCAQGPAVESLFSACCWRVKSVKKDWSGHDRFFFLEFE